MRSSELGYGSHSFLNEYIGENRCRKIMEIGVADGENARAMVMVSLRNFDSSTYPLDNVSIKSPWASRNASYLPLSRARKAPSLSSNSSFSMGTSMYSSKEYP